MECPLLPDPDPQAERYRKEMAIYLRQKKRQDEQRASTAPKKGGNGAAAGIKSKAKKLVPPKKPKAAVVSACLGCVVGVVRCGWNCDWTGRPV
eukprot:1159846-Pelagomonas_calceolata.AAC.12